MSPGSTRSASGVGKQGNLMRNELLEQDIGGLEQRIWNCWKATIQVTPARGLHTEDVGYMDALKPNSYADKETTPSPVFQHPQTATAFATRD